MHDQSDRVARSLQANAAIPH